MIDAYQTYDGQYFTNREVAIRHELIVLIQEDVDKEKLIGHVNENTTSYDIAAYVARNYEKLLCLFKQYPPPDPT